MVTTVKNKPCLPKIKQKNNERIFKLLDQCKAHGGPVTNSTLTLLDTFSHDKCMCEVLYLKNVIAQHLKIKKRTDLDPLTKRYKIVDIPADILKRDIKNTICPAISRGSDVESLLKSLCL